MPPGGVVHVWLVVQKGRKKYQLIPSTERLINEKILISAECRQNEAGEDIGLRNVFVLIVIVVVIVVVGSGK